MVKHWTALHKVKGSMVKTWTVLLGAEQTKHKTKQVNKTVQLNSKKRLVICLFSEDLRRDARWKDGKTLP